MNPYHYAAIVGINRYPGISDLEGPVNDANDFHNWLTTSGGVPENNVKDLLTPQDTPAAADVSDARPIKVQVDDVLEELHSKVASDTADDLLQRWHQSRLYVFLAGHGIMPRGGDSALLLANARNKRYENFEVSKYVEWYRKHGGMFKEVVFFADCCRNWCGQVEPCNVPFDLSLTGPPATVFSLAGYACAPGDPAYEEKEATVPPKERRGYFTKALLRGLGGAASVDPTVGAITAATLGSYVKFAVIEATRDKRVPQDVKMPSSDITHTICFGTPGVVPTSDVRILFPPAFTRRVELRHTDGTRESFADAPRPWSLKLRDGLYSVDSSESGDGTSFANDGVFVVIGERDVQL
jgi:hypothetical protein